MLRRVVRRWMLFAIGIALTASGCGARTELDADNGAPSRCQVDANEGRIEIATGSLTLARKADKTLWQWGPFPAGFANLPSRIDVLGTNVARIAASFHHACAIQIDGSLWCWGSNRSGELGDGTRVDHLSPVAVSALEASVCAVAAGGFGGLDAEAGHTCAIESDGSLWCWGANDAGQLGDGSHDDSSMPVQVTALANSVATVSAGGQQSCAIKSDGSLWCWGRPDIEGSDIGSSVPLQVAALGNSVAAVSPGLFHTCAIKTDRSLWCWGGNASGQLGNGTTTRSAVPVRVSALGTVTAVSAGVVHTCAIRIDGSLWCWGYNWKGQLGNGTTEQANLPVQVMLGSVESVGVQIQPRGRIISALQSTGAKLKRLSMRSARVFVFPA